MKRVLCIFCFILLAACIASAQTPTPTPDGGAQGMHVDYTVTTTPQKVFRSNDHAGPYWIYNLSDTDVWLGYTEGGRDYRLIANQGAWNGIMSNGRLYIGDVWAETSSGTAEIYIITLRIHRAGSKQL